MRIGLAQTNPLIGDFAGNVGRIGALVQEGMRRGCELIIFPELSVVGYPPRDLLDRPSFYDASLEMLPRIERMSHDVALVCGTITKNPSHQGKPYRNTVLFLEGGRIVAQGHKRLLPFYDVFDEERYFEPGEETVILPWRGLSLGLTVCEDIWNREGILPRRYYPFDPVADLAQANASLVVNVAASPYFLGKMEQVMIPLLRRVALEVSEASVGGLVGRNGAGKTITLRAVMGRGPGHLCQSGGRERRARLPGPQYGRNPRGGGGLSSGIVSRRSRGV